MKKTIITAIMAIVSVFAFQTTVLADNGKPITVDQLPTAAQKTISHNFKGKKITLAKQEKGFIDKSYEVLFADGTVVEFDRKGVWTEIDCRKTGVPAGLVPAQISGYVDRNHAGEKIVKIEKDTNGRWEVKLSNKVEISFTSKFAVADVDID